MATALCGTLRNAASRGSTAARHLLLPPLPARLNSSEKTRSSCPRRGDRRRGAHTGVQAASGTGTSELAGKKCSPCEADGGSLNYMGLCEAMDRRTAEQYLQQIVPSSGAALLPLDGWELEEDDQARLHLKRMWKTKSFVKGLALCEKIAEVAEGEGHHPDLHLTDWNRLTVNIWTHARNGLTENDFILAAKLDAIDKQELLRGKKKSFADI